MSRGRLGRVRAGRGRGWRLWTSARVRRPRHPEGYGTADCARRTAPDARGRGVGRTRRAAPPSARVPCLPHLEPVEPTRRHAAGGAGLRPDRRGDRRRGPRARRLRLRALGGRADRDPGDGGREGAGQVAGLLRVRERVGQGPVSDSDERRDRGRPPSGRRPARADRRPRQLQALRVVRALSDRGRRLAGRLRRDLRPPLEQAPAGRLDVRRRGRPARSCPASRATRRSRAAGSTMRSGSPSRARAERTSGRHATSRATRPIRACRRWGCGSA